MCLYPKLIKNRKYTVTKKNGGNVPEIKDPRTAWVPVGCQKCIECKKQKGRAWSIRLQEEIRNPEQRIIARFVTLTFSNESIYEITRDIAKNNEGILPEGYELDNEIATRAVRLFLERWRKEYGTSIKHWLVTELGQTGGYQGTEHLHLHGIIFTNKPNEISRIWKYGHVWIGQYVNEKTINYCVKYSTKVDQLHKEYNAKILTSPGMGSSYTDRLDAKRNAYNKNNKTNESYITRQGAKMNLPVYWRNKIYSEEEREKLWIEKLDKDERWVLGQKISTKDGYQTYYNELIHARRINKQLGYGNDEVNWQRRTYENNRRKMNMEKRLSKNLEE